MGVVLDFSENWEFEIFLWFFYNVLYLWTYLDSRSNLPHRLGKLPEGLSRLR